MTGRLGIDDVVPFVETGDPSKAVVGEVVPIRATVWREGHDAVAANVVWTPIGDDGSEGESEFVRMEPEGVGTDRFVASVVPSHTGRWRFRVDAWSDPWTTWRNSVEKKLEAGQTPDELANDLETGARLLQRVGRRPSEKAQRDLLMGAANALRDTALPLRARVAPALFPAVVAIMTERPVRELITLGPEREVFADRQRALFSSWYEIFPRSTGGRDETGRPVHGTFVTATKELDRIAKMGFDVVYLPPIHPVGTMHRKGRNNSVNAEAGDVGSPWAIGSAEGGHDAIDPELGDFDDFDAFVARTNELGMEVALDFALQCAPDHPWVTEHPEWFTVRPDGTIAYAENPPKRYQDIYPLNFDRDPAGLYAECLRVALKWVEHGVRIFRVDNPHTKPPNFWHWLIWEIKKQYPDVLFLAEAFTRPARLFGLARLGFSQSYTYFTWRTGKEELAEFVQMHAEHADECRPNLFTNTPDILHESLQTGGPGMFAIRATLAATMSPTWGVYSGFELYEGQAVKEGSEEYLDSEKYELRPRDFHRAVNQGRSLEPYLTQLNDIRREHPALQQLREVHIHDVDNDELLAYSKLDPTTGDQVLVVINLSSSTANQGTISLDMPALGLRWEDIVDVRDEITGQTFQWGERNFVRLLPWDNVAHVISLPKQRPVA